jgi:uncharacterized membrane protein
MSEQNQENKGLAGLLFQVSCFIGTCLSLYSLYHHKLVKLAEGATGAACNISSTVNCDAVASSAYSEIAGIPLGAFGLGFFIPLMLLFANGYQLGKLSFPTLGIFGESSKVGDRLIIVSMLGLVSLHLWHLLTFLFSKLVRFVSCVLGFTFASLQQRLFFI